MSTTQKVVVTAARLGGAGLLAIAVVACATSPDGPTSSQISPSSSVTTVMAGWEEKFALEWWVEPEPGGGQRIRGYVVSRYGRAAESLRVLGQALDSSGGVVDQRITWVPRDVSGFGHSYFEIPRLPSADHFRVTVWDYSVRKR
jgi:hypothetical protein